MPDAPFAGAMRRAAHLVAWRAFAARACIALAIVPAVASALPAAVGAESNAQRLPSEFRHDRIFVTARAAAGPDRVLYTDSGGGWNAITRTAAAELGLVRIGVARDEGRSRLPLVAFPASFERSGIPRPLVDPWLQGGLVVAPEDGVFEGDGFLGARWFAGRIWRIDYGQRTFERLVRLAGVDATKRVALGLRRGAGPRASDFARVTVAIDGQPIDLLLDTGATATLTAGSAPLFGLPAGTRVGASFIVRSIFERWHDAHPDWRVVDGDQRRDTPSPMIEVPAVGIGGVTVGPVWFAQRPDVTYRTWVSKVTDRPVDGALGGSALRYLRVTLDYPQAAAYFEAAVR